MTSSLFRRLAAMTLASATLIGGLGLATHSAAADDSAAVSVAGKTTISVGDTWYDTGGNPIEAHGASTNLYHESEVGIDINGDGDASDDIYLLYGENKTHATRPVDGINGYWSEDLITWHNMGNVLPTHQILPYKSVAVTADDDYIDVDSTRPAVGSKYAVFDEDQYARLKTLANLSQAEAKAQGVEQTAASAKAFVKAYVTEWDADGNAIAYDEEHLRLAFQYLDGDFNVVERPMNVYNPKTKKFMIIFHADSPVNANTKLNSWIDACRSDAQFVKDGTCNTASIGNMPASRYGRAQIGFAQSDTPFGPFTLVNSTRMNYDTDLNSTRLGESRGMNLFVDDADSNNDGVNDVYAVYASEMNKYMYVSRLNDTYTGPETEGDAVKPGESSTWNARILPETGLEASPVFKWNGEYYMFSKGTNGWGDATVYLFQAKSMLQSQWKKIGNPFVGDMAESAYKSEPNHIIVKDAAKGEFIYTGERWVVDPTTGSAGKDSKMIWLPIMLTGDEDDPVHIEGRASWNPNDGTVYRPVQELGNWTMGSTLPGKLDIGGASVAVTWDEESVSAANAAEEFSSVRLTGSLADGSRVSASVRAIPANLRYLIDSGNTGGDANTSELYGSVAKDVDLLNAVADQEWDGSSSGKTWGYSTQAGVATGFTDAAEWKDSYVGANFNKPVTYHLTLPAGTYMIGTVQAPRSGQTTNIYSTVRVGEQTIGERKEAVSDGSATRIIQEVTVPASTDGKASVVDVEFGTNATKGYNARLALVWVASSQPETPDPGPEPENGRFGAAAQEFRLEGEPDADNAKIFWDASVEGADTYTVYRGTGDDRTLVANTTGNRIDDYDLPMGQDVVYTIEAKSGGKDGHVVATATTNAVRAFTPTNITRVKDNVSTKESDVDSKPGTVRNSSDEVAAQVASDSDASVKYRYSWKNVANDDGTKTLQIIQSVSSDGGATYGDPQVVWSKDDRRIEGAHFVTNPRTGHVIGYGHLESSKGYSLAQLVLIEIDPGKGVVDEYADRPLGYDSRGLTLYTENDAAYIVSSVNNNRDVLIAKLNDEWTQPDHEITKIFVGEHLEAAAIYKIEGTYFTFASGTSGWYPSQTRYTSSQSIESGWSDTRQVANVAFNDSQFDHFSISKGDKRTTYTAVGYHWGASRNPQTPLGTSTRATPLVFHDGFIGGAWYSKVEFDAEYGAVPVQSGRDMSRTASVSDSEFGDDPSVVGLLTDGMDQKEQQDAKQYLSHTGKPYEVTYRFEDSQPITEFDLTTRLVSGSETAYQYALSVSDNGTDWREIVDARNNVFPGFVVNKLSEPVTAKYLKLTVYNWPQAKNGKAAFEGLLETTVLVAAQSATPDPDPEPPVSEVDKTVLIAAIDAAKAVNLDGYTEESVQAFREALTEAEAVAADESATQIVVDNAVTALLNAETALERGENPAPMVNRDVLAAAVAAASKLIESDYTAESWAPFAKALADAKAVAEDANASQNEIDAKAIALIEAQSELVTKMPAQSVDKTSLNMLIGAMEGMDLSGYTEETVQAFAEALKSAKAVAADETADQSAVNDALLALAKSRAALMIAPVAKPEVDRSVLDMAIAAADKLAESDYTAESWAPFAKALAAAKSVGRDADQSAVNTAVINLVQAKSGLVETVPTPDPIPTPDPGDATGLVDVIKVAESLKEADYTQVSFAKFAAALAEAKTIAADETATQEAIDAAKDALIDAQSKLIKVADSDIDSDTDSDTDSGIDSSVGDQSGRPANQQRTELGDQVQGSLPKTGVAVLGLAAVVLIVAAAGLVMMMPGRQGAKES